MEINKSTTSLNTIRHFVICELCTQGMNIPFSVGGGNSKLTQSISENVGKIIYLRLTETTKQNNL